MRNVRSLNVYQTMLYSFRRICAFLLRKLEIFSSRLNFHFMHYILYVTYMSLGRIILKSFGKSFYESHEGFYSGLC